MVVPEDLAVWRVDSRVRSGGQAVPEEKVRSRYRRLFPLVVEAITKADVAIVYDNGSPTTPLRIVATYANGRLVCGASWPTWTPAALRDASAADRRPLTPRMRAPRAGRRVDA